MADGIKIDIDKNVILYGPPGTGKTYNTVLYAVSIVEDKLLADIRKEVDGDGYTSVFDRYIKYKNDGLIAFTTFHQSYGYEEFIEGIRPKISAGDGKDIEYEIRDGIFKAFCDKNWGIGENAKVWNIWLSSDNDPNLKQYCFDHDCVRLGSYGMYDNVTEATDFSGSGRAGTIVSRFHNDIKVGDIIVTAKSTKEIDSIGIVTGKAECLDNDPRGEIDDYHRSLPVKWCITNTCVDVWSMNANTNIARQAVTPLRITPNDIIGILHQLKPQLFTTPNRVFIIDEINRGNISKIFGELITLIEPPKRIGESEGQKVKLPYSGQEFGVPKDVFIIGTMNTADRSIAMIDTALRRRFSFVEMQPDSSLLKDVIVDDIIDIAKMLDTMNERITVLLDREHTIGHSYFLPLRGDDSIENLAEIFEKKIMPLLQEYFFDDYKKIQFVLGDNQKTDNDLMFVTQKSEAEKLFGNNVDRDFPEYYEINKKAFKMRDAYEFLN